MPSSTSQSADFGREYSATLQRYLRRGGEAGLARAGALGRRGLDEGLGVVNMAALHQEAMVQVMNSPDARKGLTPAAFVRASEFFSEAMSPFEMAHREYAEANAVLRQMNQALEDEIKRIAHAIHDGAGQLLAAVHMALDQIERDLTPSAQARLGVVKKYLDDLYKQLRNLSHDLRPTVLDDLGLMAALETLSEGVACRSGLHVTVQSSSGVRLSPPLETALYRVVQEALTNIHEHAQATSVAIQFRISGRTVRCSIVDDGVGFHPCGGNGRSSGSGFGLMGIREKLQPWGGALKIESAPGQGTKLFITVPRRD